MTIEEVIFKWETWVMWNEISIQESHQNYPGRSTSAAENRVELVKNIIVDLKQATTKQEVY